MNVQPLNFKEFDAASAANRAPAAGIKPLLPGGRRREAAPPSPSSYNEEQLKAAEREAYKKGFLEGTEEGKKQAESEQASIDRKLAETVEKFARSVTPLLSDYRAMALQMKQDMIKVAMGIARKVAGDALAQNSAAEVEAIALRCVETMIAEPRIAITVHESVAASLEKRLQALKEKLQASADIVVVRDAAINPADCKIEWKYGAMERHTGTLWDQIDKAVGTLAAGAAHTAEKHLDAVAAQVANPENPTPKE